MKSAITGLSLASVAVLGLAAQSNAAVLVSADFNAPTYTDGALVPADSTATTTTAGQDGWLNTSGGGTANIQVSNTATNGTVAVTANGQDVRKIAAGNQGIASGSALFSFSLTLTSANATGDYFIHLGDGSSSGFYSRIYAKSTTGGFLMAMNTGAGTPTYGTTVLTTGTTYNVLARYDIVAGATNDTGALFINPTSADGSADTAYVAAATVGADAAYISSMSLRQSTTTPVATIDNMSVSGTLTTVPEPTSVAALALAGVGLLRRRRA